MRAQSGVVFPESDWRKSRHSNPSGCCVELACLTITPRRTPGPVTPAEDGADGEPGSGRPVPV